MKRKMRIMEEDGSPVTALQSFNIFLDFSRSIFLDCTRALFWRGIEPQFACLDTSGLNIYSSPELSFVCCKRLLGTMQQKKNRI